MNPENNTNNEINRLFQDDREIIVPPSTDPTNDLQQDMHILTGLLHRFRHYLFTPPCPQIDKEELAREADRFLERANAVRPLSNYRDQTAKSKYFVFKWPWPFPEMSFPVPAMALAAGLCLLLGGGYWILRSSTGPGIIQMAVLNETGMFPTTSEHMTFRGQPGEPLPLYDPANSPVAYLFDTTGQVSVTRATNLQARVSAACFLIQTNDIITAGPRSFAIIIHTNAVYFLSNAANYRITGNGIIMDGRGKPPVPETQIAGLIMSPIDLLAPAVCAPDLSVQPDAPAAVLSPRGATYSQTPDVVWLGSDRETYEVGIQPLSTGADVPALVFKPQQVHGCVLHWADTGWPPLPRSSSWQVVIRRSDTIVSDQENRFAVLTPDSAERLTHKLAEIDRLLPSGHAQAFVKAVLMLNADPSCAAEARLLAIRLSTKAPKNIVYLKLIQHAYARMGFQKAVDKIESQIARSQHSE